MIVCRIFVSCRDLESPKSSWEPWEPETTRYLLLLTAIALNISPAIELAHENQISTLLTFCIVAYVDSKGRFFIVDRLKELIKVKGNQVAPAELEALLLEHPQLTDAAVIGVTIDEQEVPRAYVVLQVQAEGSVSEEEIKDWLAKRVSRYKRLDGGVVFVDSIPKNPVSHHLQFLTRLTGYSPARFYVSC